MPPITIAGVLFFITLNFAAGYYIYRKISRLLIALSPKRAHLFRIGTATAVTLLMLLSPLTIWLRNVMKAESPELFYLTSLWFIWLVIMFSLFLPADALLYLWRQSGRLGQYLARRLKPPTPRLNPNAALSGALRTESKPPEAVDVSRRQFLITATATGLAIPTVITGYSIFNNRADYRINRFTLTFPNLPSELRGLKIAQVSDIHSGPFMSQRQMEAITEAVNELQPDLVALTGDFVATMKSEIEPFVDGFKNLKSTFGTVSCLGNHDEWVDESMVAEAMAARNLGLLRNTTRVIEFGGTKLNVMGMDYTSSNTALFDAAKETAHPDGFNLLLCHHPSFFEIAKTRKVDLMLAGHTHGGQIALDLGVMEFYPIDFIYKYSRGLYEEGAAKENKLYVNLGVGITATPLRTVQAEIALITLA